MKKNKYKKALFIVIFFFFLFIIIYFILKPFYNVRDRVGKIKSFEEKHEEKPLGWLRVQGTNIDFPIFYRNDVDIESSKYDLGWSFNDTNKLSKKVTIFSHNILNVSSTPLIGEKTHSRFEQLMAYVYTDFVKENKYIQYTVGGHNYLYKIYGVSFQEEEKLDYYDSNPSKKRINNYIKYTKDKSYFDFSTDVKDTDNFITLVTCTRFFGETTKYSFVVDARMVRKNELVKNYKISEKKNYKKIKKKLEGDVDDESI